MNRRLEAKVSGVVQGVMFRDFARRQATKLGITGYVQNHTDGSVRVVAEGKEEDLQTFVSKLWRGPFLTRIRMQVDNVETEFGDATGEFTDFVIKHE